MTRRALWSLLLLLAAQFLNITGVPASGLWISPSFTSFSPQQAVVRSQEDDSDHYRPTEIFTEVPRRSQRRTALPAFMGVAVVLAVAAIVVMVFQCSQSLVSSGAAGRRPRALSASEAGCDVSFHSFREQLQGRLSRTRRYIGTILRLLGV